MGTFAVGRQISATLRTAVALKCFNTSLPSGCQSVFISPSEPFLILPEAGGGSLWPLPKHGPVGGLWPCLAG